MTALQPSSREAETPARLSDYEAIDQIWSVLKAHPRGISSQHVAEQLGWKRNRVDSRLSKMFAYGLIAREEIPGAANGTTRYRYKLKPKAAAAT